MIDFAALFNRSPNAYLLLDRRLSIVEVNDALLRTTGRTREGLLGVDVSEAFPGNPDDPDDSHVHELREAFLRVIRTAQPEALSVIRYSIPRETLDGTVFDDRYWSATLTPVLDAAGEVEFVLEHTMDVTELHSLKAELQQARDREGVVPIEQKEGNVFTRARAVQDANRQLDAQRLHLLKLFEEAPGFMAFLRGPDHVYELANRAYLTVAGHRDLIGKSVREALPELRGQGYFELLDQVYATGKAFVGRGMEVDIARPGSDATEHVYIDLVFQPVMDADGSVAGILLQGHDITAQTLAQVELDRYRNHLEDLVQARTRALESSETERRAMAAALLQSQKMEAVGRLTGGVAHDFNNVLQIIGANLQLLSALPALQPGALQRARAALSAVERGAKLASHLLAFARRQPLNPVVFNLGEHLRRLSEMLAHTLGEEIELQVEIASELANIEADVHQLENVVLNLAINARDAMGRTGRLTIASRNVGFRTEPALLDPEVPPGQYVLLTVSDTGHGMSEDVLQRAFEPFFTTKSANRGTGLGLSMVYGFVKQSGGHIQIDSAPGCGTTVRIYLPRSDSAETLVEPVIGPTVGGTETVLVVEDDAAVRESVVDLLLTLGYRTHAAADAQVALRMLQAGLEVDLLFTDVVMPGPIQSPELARRARALLPAIAVLFTSGYTEDTIFHDGRLDPGIELLSKPYRHEALARRVRQLLDSRGADMSTPPEPTRGSPAPGAALKILFVEDDDANRVLVAELLQLFGHEVTAVGHAGDALAQLPGRAWDVLLSDVELPGMSGIELAEQARASSPGLRVVFLSGYAADQLGERGVGDRWVQKPFSPEQLQAALLGG